MLTRWRNKEFIDVHVVASGERFPAHKLVLSCGSDYMAALFSNSFSDSNSEDVYLHDVSAQAISAILEYLYAGECSLSDEEELLPILRAASRLQIQSLMDACADAVRQRLCLENVVGGIELANELVLPQLKEAAIDLIASNFQEISSASDSAGNAEVLYALPGATLEAVLQLDTLQVASEEAACDAVLRWVKHHKPSDERRASLFAALRLHWTSWDYLASLRSEPVVDPGVLADACLAKGGCFKTPPAPPRAKDPTILALVTDAPASMFTSNGLSTQTPMSAHPELNKTMREILIDWLWEVAAEHSIGHVDVGAAALLVDRFLAATTNCKRAEYQLLGISCLRLRLASSSTTSLTPQQAVFLTDDTYNLEELYAMERRVAAALCYDFRAPTPRAALALLTELAEQQAHRERPLPPSSEEEDVPARKYSDTASALCEYLCDLSVEKAEMLRWQPIEVAASALLIARHHEKKQPVRLAAGSVHWLRPTVACVNELRRLFEANRRNGRSVPEILRKNARFTEVSKNIELDRCAAEVLIREMAPQVRLQPEDSASSTYR